MTAVRRQRASRTTSNRGSKQVKGALTFVKTGGIAIAAYLLYLLFRPRP